MNNDFPKLISNKRIFHNPKRYLSFFDQNKHNISNVSIVPPQLGKKGFGRIQVEMKTYSDYGITK